MVAACAVLGINCGGPRERSPSTFVIGLEAAATNLDPRLAADATSAKICQLIYSGLFRLDDSLALQPELLESYTQISPTHYRFTLRPQLEFHDGRPLTVADVIWTYNSIRKREVPSPYYSGFEKIATLKAVDDRSFELILKEPFAPFLSALTMGILPRHYKEKEHIGAGPYRFVSEVPEQKIVLEGFAHYFNGAPRARRLEFLTMRDDNLRVLELVRGRIDLLQNTVPAPLIPYVESNTALQVDRAPGINYSYLGFNLEEPALKVAKVRQAIAHAVDREQMIAYKLKGTARPATGILAPMHWAYARPTVRYPYNPARARQLLDEAGFPDPDGAGPAARFTIIYKTSSKRDRVGLARLIAQYLAAVGIEVVVTPYEWGTLFRDIRTGNFELYSLTWVGVTEPDIYYYAFNSKEFPPAGANRNHYVNARIDFLTEAGRTTIEREKRQEIYREIQEIVAQDLPYVSLWYEDNVVARQANIKGYTIYPNASFNGLANLYRDES